LGEWVAIIVSSRKGQTQIGAEASSFPKVDEPIRGVIAYLALAFDQVSANLRSIVMVTAICARAAVMQAADPHGASYRSGQRALQSRGPFNEAERGKELQQRLMASDPIVRCLSPCTASNLLRDQYGEAQAVKVARREQRKARRARSRNRFSFCTAVAALLVKESSYRRVAVTE
jgi:hypothetical protein